MKRKTASKKGRRVARVGSKRVTLRVSLCHIEPPVWREISIPDTYSLLQVHRCIQLLFGWLDYHLFEFQVNARRFEGADPEAEGEDAARVQLRDLGLPAGASFRYIYDMGDYWEHDVAVQAVEDISPGEEPDPLGYLLDGARAAPPEDAGGPPGYENAIAAFIRRASEEDEEMVVWLGPGFDPELFDRRAANHALMLATAWGVI